MKIIEWNKNILAACIIAMGMIVASVIYAYSTRYEIVQSNRGGILRVDKWDGSAGYITRQD